MINPWYSALIGALGSYEHINPPQLTHAPYKVSLFVY